MHIRYVILCFSLTLCNQSVLQAMRDVRSTKSMPTLHSVVKKITKRQKKRAQNPTSYHQTIDSVLQDLDYIASSADASLEENSYSSDTDMEADVEKLAAYFTECANHNSRAWEELANAQAEQRYAYVDPKASWRCYLAALQHNESIVPQ